MDILTIGIIVVWILAIPVFIRYLFLNARKKRLMKEAEKLAKEQTNRSK